MSVVPREDPDRLIAAYRRILRAARLNRGVRLSADEVWDMSRDNAIEAAVATYDEERRNDHD